MWDALKAELRKQVIALSAYVKTSKHLNTASSYSKKLKTGEQDKIEGQNEAIRKKITKIKAEINEPITLKLENNRWKQ